VGGEFAAAIFDRQDFIAKLAVLLPAPREVTDQDEGQEHIVDLTVSF
jgi:hypothetical protein